VKTIHKYVLVVGLALAAPAGLLALAGPAPAEPQAAQPVQTLTIIGEPSGLSGYLAEAKRVQKHIDELNDQIEIVTEEYNLASWQLTQLDYELADAREELRRMDEELALQQAVLTRRVQDIYRMGDLTTLDALLSAHDLSAIETQNEFMRRLNLQDQATTDSISRLTEDAVALSAKADEGRQDALLLEQSIAEKRIIVEDHLAELEATLNNTNEHITAILAKQRASETTGAAGLRAIAEAALARSGAAPARIAAVRESMRYLGVDYVWGGATPSGFDCSGLVMYVFAQYGVRLPHFAAWQAIDHAATQVSLSELQAGDLIFWGAPIHHVAIYIADGLFIQAPHTGDVVKITRLSDYETPIRACRYPLTN